jgi:REP element-mobilizing transposase RayT
MIAGYHIVFGTYGFWLPNDPRGSWSAFVGSWDLLRFGPATTTTQRRSLAGRRHDRGLRLAAKSALKRAPVRFTGVQARAVAQGIGDYALRSNLPIWACAVLPDHVHLVVAPPGMDVERLVIQLKGAATRSLVDQGVHPFGAMQDKNGRPPKCFARGQWKVYLDREDLPRAIRYVEDNPLKEGKPRQHWSFVTAYRG